MWNFGITDNAVTEKVTPIQSADAIEVSTEAVVVAPMLTEV
jgi:hypothetical protein